MNASRLSPGITSMIRLDHTHVMAVFHRYRDDTSAMRKRALVRNACLALEVHAQLEEEIFYPALRAVTVDSRVLDKSVPEHEAMRGLIAKLGTLRPDDVAHDQTFRELMRIVIHHVADEEAVLLPEAERVLAPRLGELGAQMTRRRLQLLGPRAREAALTTVQSFPVLSVVFAVGAVALAALALNGRAGRLLRRA
jgi:hypothetical protein